MLSLLVFFLLVSSLSAQRWPSKTGHPKRQIIANEQFDQLLKYTLRKISEANKRTIDLPDIDDEINGLYCNGGTLSDLTTLQRVGNAVLTTWEKNITLTASLRLGNFYFGYTNCSTEKEWKPFKRYQWINGDVGGHSFDLQISVRGLGKQMIAEIEKLSVNHIDNINLSSNAEHMVSKTSEQDCYRFYLFFCNQDYIITEEVLTDRINHKFNDITSKLCSMIIKSK